MLISECNGEILFVGKTLTDYTELFEIILSSETAYDCAKTCFHLNCTRAAFTHFPRSACLLHFSSTEEPLESKCGDSDNFVSNWEFKQVAEVVNIICVKCIHHDEQRERILRDEFNSDNFNHEEHIVNTMPQHIINPQGTFWRGFEEKLPLPKYMQRPEAS